MDIIRFSLLVGGAFLILICFYLFCIYQGPIMKFRDVDGNILIKKGDLIAWKEDGTLFQGVVDEIRKDDEKALVNVYTGYKGRKVIQL